MSGVRSRWRRGAEAEEETWRGEGGRERSETRVPGVARGRSETGGRRPGVSKGGKDVQGI